METDKKMESKTIQVKICGITRPEEAGYLNESGADYAGFVFYPESKRNVSFEKAGKLSNLLDGRIKRVAVTVSPNVELTDKIIEAGFDVIQVHKRLEKSLLERISIPVWYAFNVSKAEEVKKQEVYFSSLPDELSSKIEGIVVDAADFGSGKTFDWEGMEQRWRDSMIFRKRKFILAGGLTVKNVTAGIEIFRPDIVDVSSGVEIASGEVFKGKDPGKIKDFCRRAKYYKNKSEESRMINSVQKG